MKLSFAITGILTPFVLAAPAEADIRAPIPGAEPVLAIRFAPRTAPAAQAAVAIPGSRPTLPARFTAASYRFANPLTPSPFGSLASIRVFAVARSDADIAWHIPLVDRTLSAAEKAAPLEQALVDAVNRIEPIYDPTRLDDPEIDLLPSVSAGTASMDSVFADSWHRAHADPNVNAKVAAIAMAWQPGRQMSCEDFAKSRTHLVVGDPALTALNEDDCRGLVLHGSTPAAGPTPIVLAGLSVPVFAAPLPGSRMSSEDFWAKRKAKVDALRLQLREKWRSPRTKPFQVADGR